MKYIMQKYGDRREGRKANFRPYAHAVCRTPMSDEVQMVVEIYELKDNCNRLNARPCSGKSKWDMHMPD